MIGISHPNLVPHKRTKLEMDFPPSSDIMTKTIDSPNAEERMEYELFSRFN